jgi:hypothetical protein
MPNIRISELVEQTSYSDTDWLVFDKTTTVRKQTALNLSNQILNRITTTAPITYNTSTRVISLSYNTTNLKLTSNALDTIQNIDTTASPAFRNLTLPDQHNASDSGFGIIYKGGIRFIHNFRHPTGGSARPLGNNVFIGLNAGNLTMGADATAAHQASGNIGIGSSVLNVNVTGYENVAIGTAALMSNLTGHSNIALGNNALRLNESGYSNIALGNNMYYNLDGYNNVAVGRLALNNNTSGFANIAIGISALQDTQTTTQNVSIGTASLHRLTTGGNNVALGHEAGRFLANSSEITNVSNSIFIGFQTRAAADSDTNEIVIGHSTIGNGSNTVTIGNTSITATFLRGFIYLVGDANTDGSWRLRGYSGGNFVIEARVSGNWVTRQTITPS